MNDIVVPYRAIYDLVKWLLRRATEFLRAASSNSTEFLNYDVNRLFALYGDQLARISEDIPYSEETCWVRETWKDTLAASRTIRIQAESEWFQLGGSTDVEISAWQQAAYNRFRQKGHAGRDTTVVRLNDFDPQTNTLSLQRAKYSQQVKSNLTLDWTDANLKNTFGSLRSLLSAKYRGVLPPLNEQLLANTVGIAVVLLFRAESGDYLPYLPKRAPNLAVFPGAYHCTASGATEAPLKGPWGQQHLTFDDIFVNDMYTELQQEVGIQKAHVHDMVPLALCREYLRAGKPQLFFAGLTDLAPSELQRCRIEAISRSRRKREKQEIEKEALVPGSLEQLKAALQTSPPTLETYPALHYARRYAKVRLAQDSKF